MSGIRIAFLTREPVVHQQGGSTTYALGLLHLLRAQGAEVALIATTAFSRSPRLFFRTAARIPEGVQVILPGYLRLGSWHVCPWRLRAWARLAARACTRRPWLQPVRAMLERLWSGKLFTGAWDLTPPTPAECDAAVRAIEALCADVVIANYAFWGPLLREDRLRRLRTAILMHDLLSARVKRFQAAGLPLDCPPVSRAEEIAWLSAPGTVLAAQEAEAAAIRPLVSSSVVVTPMLLAPRALDPAQVVEGRCLFVGSNILPNQTALAFLLENVWPRVRAQVPGAVLAVAGTVGAALDRGPEPQALSSLGVEKLGMVPDLQAEYARASVVLVPLQIGTGIKIKLVEALAYGKAIVSTPVGVQGLETWAADAMEVAPDADSFVASTVRLLTDASLRRRHERAALREALQHFGPAQQLSPDFVRAVL